MQVDPNKPTLKAPGTECLRLKCKELLSNFGSKFDLRRYILGTVHEQAEYNAGGRSQVAAGGLVAWFNGLLMVGNHPIAPQMPIRSISD